MNKVLASVSLFALAALFAGGAAAQDAGGSISKAVGGYTCEDAAKESDATKNFHSADGHLTFAIVTHTAGNGFFDPVYVGATVAGNMIGAKLVLLGSEAPIDDIPREIEILNQIIQDPTIDGLILTTPQVGAYNDIVKKHARPGHSGRDDELLRPDDLRPRRHQPHRPECRGGGDRRRGAGQVRARQGTATRARSSSRRRRPRAMSRSTIASPPPSTRP